MVGLFLQSGYALLPSQPHHRVSSRLTRNLTLFVARHIGRWITFYNHHRPHTAHGGQPPAVVYFTATQIDQQVQAVA